MMIKTVRGLVGLAIITGLFSGVLIGSLAD